jgi:hypothetical protein
VNPLLYYLSRRVAGGLPPSTLSSSRLFHRHHRHRRDPDLGSELRTTGAVFDTTFPRFLSRFDDAIDDEEEFTSNEDEDSDGRGGVGGRGHHHGGGGGATRTASGSSAKALLQNRAKMPPNARVNSARTFL